MLEIKINPTTVGRHQLLSTIAFLQTFVDGKSLNPDIQAAVNSPTRVATKESLDQAFAETAAAAENDPLSRAYAEETAAITAACSAGETATVDSNGLPWDERIHSSNHKFSKDGTWQYRRGVDMTEVKRVEAELFNLMKAPAQPAPAALDPASYYVPPNLPISQGLTAAPPPPPPVPSVAADAVPFTPPPPPVPAAAPAMSANDAFVKMIGMAMPALAAGKVTQVEIDGICLRYSVPSMNMLPTRQDICLNACNEIITLIQSRGV